MYMSIYKNKTKHICKQKNSENKFKKREENHLATSSVRSGEKTYDVGGWKQQEREMVLGIF